MTTLKDKESPPLEVPMDFEESNLTSEDPDIELVTTLPRRRTFGEGAQMAKWAYTGQWSKKHDQPHGQGLLIDRLSVQHGTFEEGRLVGLGRTVRVEYRYYGRHEKYIGDEGRVEKIIREASVVFPDDSTFEGTVYLTAAGLMVGEYTLASGEKRRGQFRALQKCLPHGV